MNPKIYNNQSYIADKVNTIVDVGKGVIVNYNIVYFALSQYYLYSTPLSPSYTPTPYETTQRLFNSAQFVCIMEFIAYWYHRFSHEHKAIYKNSHKDHHINIQVYPIDFLEFDYIDNIAQTLYINLPLYFAPMHIHDYALIYYIYATSAFLIHSPLITNHHIIHHRYFKCNYSLLFPIFDILFGTYVGHH